MCAATRLDWSAVVKPLLSSSFYGNGNAAYLKRLVQTICSCSEEIFSHDQEYETFYTTFLALGMHYITLHLSLVEESDREAVLAAVRVVVDFTVDRLNRTERPRLLHSNHFIAILSGMCSGEGSLPRVGIISLSAHLKTTLLPPHIKATVRRENPSTEVAPVSIEEDSEKSGATPSEGHLVEKVISSFSNYVSFDAVPSQFAPNPAEADSVETMDFKLRFSQENQRLLKELHVGELLLKAWLKGKLITPFKDLYKAHVVNSAPNFIVPADEYERVQRYCGKILERTTNACSILSLPLFSDPASSVVNSLLDVTGTCLMAAGCAMIAIYSPFNERADESVTCFSACPALSVVSVIEKAKTVCVKVLRILVDSCVDKEQVYRFHLISLGCLTQIFREATDTIARQIFSPSDRVVAHEFFWSFMFLLRQADVAKIGSECFDGRAGRFNLVTPLLRIAEAAVEVVISEQERNGKRPSAETTVVSKPSGKVELAKLAGAAAGSSDSDTEPVLGKWIEDLMSCLPQMMETVDRQNAEGQCPPEAKGNFKPAEAAVSVACESFSMLGAKIFDKSVDKDRERNAFRLHLIEMDIPYVARILTLLCDANVSSDNPNDPIGRMTQAFHPLLHNMLVSDGFSDVFACKLLSLTGIKLEYSMCPSTFRFQHPLRLKLISQAVFLSLCRPADRDVDSYRNELVSTMWNNAISALAEAAMSRCTNPEDIYLSTDLSYHFAQFLLLFYYSLPKDEKSAIIVFTLKTLNRFFSDCSAANRPVVASVFLARLLLLFEVLIRYGSSPCPEFIDKIQEMLSPAWFNCQLKMHDPWLRSPIFITDAHAIANASKSLSELAGDASAVNHPLVFYQLHRVEFDDYLCDSLDPLAASVLFETDGYDYVYQSLVNLLFQFTEFDVTRDVRINVLALFRRYCAATILRLTSLLPPSRCFSASVDSSKNESVIRQLYTIVIRTSIRYMDPSRGDWFKKAAVPSRTWEHIQGQMTSPHLMMHWLSTALHLLHNRSWVQSAQDVYTRQDCQEIFRSIVTTDLILVHMRIWLHKFLCKENCTDEELGFIPVSTVLAVLKRLLAHVRMILVQSCESDLAEVTGVPPSFVVYLLALIGNDKAVPPHRLGELCRSPLPAKLLDTIAEWNELSLDSFPADFVTSIDYSSGVRNLETLYYRLIEAHLANLTRKDEKGVLFSLKHAARSASRFIQDLSRVNFGPWKREVFKKWYVPLRYDSAAAYLLDYGLISERYDNGHPLQLRMAILEAKYAISNCYELIVLSLSETKFTNCSLISECLEYLKGCLNVPHEKSILFSILAADEHVVQSLLRSFGSAHTVYLHQLLNFFTSLFREGAVSDGDKNLSRLCDNILNSFIENRQILIDWFKTLIRNVSQGCNVNVLANMSSFVTEVRHFLAKRQEEPNFSQNVLALMDSFVRSMSVPSLIKFLEWKLTTEKPSDGLQRNDVSIWFIALYKLGRLCNAECMPQYIHYILDCCSRAMSAFASLYTDVPLSTSDGFQLVAAEMICFLGALIANALTTQPEQEARDESTCSDNDLDSVATLGDLFGFEQTKRAAMNLFNEESISNVCTFTETLRDFKQQHWYFCYSCGITDGRGICSTCRRVCHLGHDVSYAKYSSFFCDCGANEGPSPCSALVRRTSQSDNAVVDAPQISLETVASKVNRVVGRRAMSMLYLLFPHLASITFDEKDKEVILQEIQLLPTFRFQIQQMFDLLFPIVHRSIAKQSPIGRQRRLATAFQNMQNFPLPSSVVKTESLTMLVDSSEEMPLSAIGSAYSADYTMMVNQLMTGNVVNLTLACQVYSDDPEELFVAVAHEKFKLTIAAVFPSALHASANADHPRTCTETLPFVVMSVSTSPAAKRLITACGYKECQVIRISTVAAVIEDRYVLSVPASSSNYIVKSVWLPESTSQLALLLCNSVLIYDLSFDEHNPLQTYTLPVGKVVDATFVCQECIKGRRRMMNKQMLVLTSNAEVFRQCLPLDPLQKQEEPTFMVEVLKVEYKRLVDSVLVGSSLGSGSSIYYSHKLRLLFISYSSGDTFVSRLAEDEIVDVALLDFSDFHESSCAMARWAEVDSCPGLILAKKLPDRCPILMFAQTKDFKYQDLSKDGVKNIMDVFLVRRNSPVRQATYVVVLTESTQLVVFKVNPNETSLWANEPSLGRRRRRHRIERRGAGYLKQRTDQPPSLVLFEYCPTVEAEFGGKDVLAVYNRSLLFSRLTSPNTNLIIKKAGVTAEVTVTTRSPNHVIRGLRIQLGGKSDSCPSYFEVLDRRVFVNSSELNRWYDVIFSIKETLNILSSVTITFGFEEDSTHIIVYNILVYAENKEHLGKNDPMERVALEEVGEPTFKYSEVIFLNHLGSFVLEPDDLKTMETMCSIKNELVLVMMMRLLKWFVDLKPEEGDRQTAPLYKIAGSQSKTPQLAMDMLCMPTDRMFEDEIEMFLKSLFTVESDYYVYKDDAILRYVNSQLSTLQSRLDCELLYWIVRLVRSIAVRRPVSLAKFMKEQEEANCPSVLVDDLMSIFHKVVSSSAHSPSLAHVAICTVEHMATIVENLVEIMFSCIRFAPERLDTYYAHFTSMVFSNYFSVGSACQKAFNNLLHYFVPRPIEEKKPEKSFKDISDDFLSAWANGEDVVEAEAVLSVGDPDWGADILNSYVQDFLADRDVSASLGRALKDVNQRISSFGQPPSSSLRDPYYFKFKGRPCEYESCSSGSNGTEESVLTPRERALCARSQIIALMIVNKLSRHFTDVDDLSGLATIPYFQVLHSAICAIGTAITYNRTILFDILRTLINSIQFQSLVAPKYCVRTSKNEVTLMKLRFLSILLFKFENKPLSLRLAVTLRDNGLLLFCYRTLSLLLRYWEDDNKPTPQKKITKVLMAERINLSPFFLHTFVSEYMSDVFFLYHQLLTDIMIRLAYQVRKILDAIPNQREVFTENWVNLLYEYVMSPKVPEVKPSVKKLLVLVMGSQAMYKRFRDENFLRTQVQSFTTLFVSNFGKVGYFTWFRHIQYYDNLTMMFDILNSCAEIANTRTGSWQYFLLCDSASFAQLLRIACSAHENIAEQAFLLIEAAFVSPFDREGKRPRPASDVLQFSGALAGALSKSLLVQSNRDSLARFFLRFLVQWPKSQRRWQAQRLLFAISSCSCQQLQQWLLQLCWDAVWPLVDDFGHRAFHFTDAMCQLTIRLCTTDQVLARFELVFERFRRFTEALMSHEHYNTCRALAPYVKLNGFPFSNGPCNACNEVESPMTLIKLQQLKEEAQYTTTSIRVKLTAYYEIAKLLLRISETRRKKSVRKISVYFSNHAISSAVELKRNDIWVLAKEFQVSEGHSEVKMDFPVPFIARCLRIEFTLFHDKGIVEVLMCPRCSAVVRSQPGVCMSCGENALQCHKCRAINYNERDPFLCNSCGFCKYGKFEFGVYCRKVPGVDQITNDEEFGKAVLRMYFLAEKAEQCAQSVGNSVTSLQYHTLLRETNGFSRELPLVVDCPSALLGNSMELCTSVHAIGQCYSIDCKKAMESLRAVQEEISTLRMVALEYERGEVSVEVLDQLLKSKPNCLACLSGLATAYGTFLNYCVRENGACKKRLFTEKAWRAFVLNVAMSDSHFRPRMIAVEIVASMAYDDYFVSADLCREIESRVLLTDEIAVCYLPVLSRCSTMLDYSASAWQRTVLMILKQVTASEWADSNESVVICCLRIICFVVKECASLSSSSTDSSSGNTAPAAQAGEEAGRPSSEDIQRAALRALLNVAPSKPAADDKSGLDKTKAFMYSTLGLVKASALDISNGLLRSESSWLEKCIFHKSSIVRLLGVELLTDLCRSDDSSGADVFGYMISLLWRLEEFGSSRSTHYLAGLISILKAERWNSLFFEKSYFIKLILNVKYASQKLSVKLNNLVAVDLSLGCYLYSLSEVFKLVCSSIPRAYERYIPAIIKRAMEAYFVSYRYDVWRSGLLNMTRDNFLAILDDVLHAEERRYLPDFLRVCISLLRALPGPEKRNLFLTFDRMCVAIDMEDKDVTEFRINIEKDPAQEDFLQGRMSGSPYSSSDPDMGPTMRDIKKKICRDCELISLLEDDNGMELLVDGKIISLDLEVAEVFKRVWYPVHGVDTMVIVYRMRGLLGDATEEFVQGFDGPAERSESEEFNLSYLFDEQSLAVMLGWLERVNKPPTCDVEYIIPLLELFHYSVKVKSNRTILLKRSLEALPRFISKLRLLIGIPFRAHAAPLPEKILYIVRRLYEEAVYLSEADFKAFVDFPEIAEDLVWFLEFLHGDCNIPVGCKDEILRTIGLLMLGSPERIELAVNYFESFSDFSRYDNNVSAEIRAEGDMMCTVLSGVTTSSFGCQVRDKFVEAGYLNRATDYLLAYAPAACRQGLTLDSTELQEFVARPGLRFTLKFLNELCRGHETSQLHVATDCVPIVHRLESVSSKEHIGSLAEGLMEILRENEVVAKKVEEARLETKRRKKQIAMEVRKKQLKRLGMQLTDSGAIVICSDKLKEFTVVTKESELSCVICRESLVGNPKKLIGLYTFSKVVDIEPYEQNATKTRSIFTVSYLNAIHYDCHVVAVRSATNRAEWESAMLHNASTRCNGLLPLLGPQVTDAEYGSALAKHHRYVHNHTGFNEFGLKNAVQDLKFLMFRIAKGESLSTDTGGGGRGANLAFLPHLAVVCLYYITSTNSYSEQAGAVEAFLEQPASDWRQSAFEPVGCLYYAVLYLLVYDPQKWENDRILLLKRLLATCGYRMAADSQTATSSEDTAAHTAYEPYAAYCNFFYLIDGMYRRYFSGVTVEGKDNWSAALKAYIAANHDSLLGRANRLLSDFEDCLQSTSFAEFCDVAGILNLIPVPDEFLLDAVNQTPGEAHE